MGTKAAAVALGRSTVVIVVPGLTGSEFCIPHGGIRMGTTGPNVVEAIDSVGYATAISFEQTSEAATLFSLASEQASARAEVTETRRRALDEIIIVTTDSLAGAEIVAVHGDVFGVVVRARNIFSNIGASLRTVAGGEAAGYTKLMVDTRNEARERLAVAAVDRGANAVVAMRYSSTEVADLMSEITAYGTAVTVSLPRD